MLTQIRTALSRAWRRLVEPPASIEGVADRRRARLLSGLLILLVPLPLILLLVSLSIGTLAVDTNSLLLGLAVIIASYALNRRGYYTPAALLLLAGLYAAVLLYAFAEQRPLPLAYLAIATLVSGLLFRPIATLYHYAFGLVLFGLFTALTPFAPASETLNVFLLLGTLGALYAVVTFLRQNDLDLIERQTDELRASEARYRALINQAPDGVFITDEQGRYLDVNDSGCAMLGYTRAELIGADYRLILSPDNVAQDPPDFGLLHDGKTLRRERTYHRKGGTHFPVDISARLISDGRSLSIVRDITKRRAAQEALQQSESQYRALIDQAADGIFITDQQGRYLDVNDSGCAMLGYTRAELIGADYRLILSPDDVAQDPPDFGLLHDGKTLRRERTYHRKGGTHFLVDISARLISDGRSLCIVRDITERRAAQEALRASEEKYRLLVERIHDVIFTIDLQGLITFISPRIEAIIGYRPEELIGRNFAPYIHPDDLSRALADFAGNLGGDSGTGEYRVLSRSGETRWVRGFNQAIMEEGRAVGMQGLLSDVTERKQMELDLRESEERLSLAVTASHQGLFDWNIASDEAYLSPIFLELAGYQPGEMEAGADFFRSSIHPDDFATVAAVIAARIQGHGESDASEFRLRQKSGEYRWVRGLSKVVARDTKGGALRMIGTISDITEQRQAEESLHLQSAALNAAANAIVITDRNGTIEWVNPAFSAITGYSAAEAHGRNPRELVNSGKHGPEFYKNLWDTILAGRVWHSEMVNRRKDGSLYPEEQTITPLKDADGGISHFIAIKQEISQRKQAEARLAERLAELQRWQTAILGRESRILELKHEVNELLATAGHPPRYGSAAASAVKEA